MTLCNLCFATQRKRVEDKKQEEIQKVTKVYEAGNIGAKDAEQKKEKMKRDTEKNVTPSRKVTISFLLYFLQIVFCNTIMQNQMYFT